MHWWLFMKTVDDMLEGLKGRCVRISYSQKNFPNGDSIYFQSGKIFEIFKGEGQEFFLEFEKRIVFEEGEKEKIYFQDAREEYVGFLMEDITNIIKFKDEDSLIEDYKTLLGVGKTDFGGSPTNNMGFQFGSPPGKKNFS